MEIPVVRNILEANDIEAAKLKEKFKLSKTLVLNLISSPGSGKTSLLERTLTDLKNTYSMGVIEGDLQTDNDAKRILATGTKAVQINTNGGCHLDSHMIFNVLEQFDLKNLDILFIENVGNLVCPVEFDCGEDYKVSILSVAEGDDKPEKYPLLFNLSSVMILNKIDLLPYVDFCVDAASKHVKNLNKDIEIFQVSCRNNQGLDLWYNWLKNAVNLKKLS